MRSVHIPNSKLTEGKTYPFLYLKNIALEPGNEYMVMQEPRGYKILVPFGFYKEYGFQTGQTILCRVDKINCNGRMFLEPQHPTYEEGKLYNFELLCKGHIIGITGEDEWYFMVRDVLGQNRKVHTGQKDLWKNPPKSINCLIQRIKKGKLFLIPEGEEYAHPGLEKDKVYPFEVVDEKRHPDDGHTYFILKDPGGNKHLLKTKYYRAYGIKKGSKINCRADKFTSGGYFFLEPEHPCYRPGDTYELPVSRMEELVFTDGFRQKVVILKDCLGEEVKVHIDDSQAKILKDVDHLQAKVVRIRKSRLEVELVNGVIT